MIHNEKNHRNQLKTGIDIKIINMNTESVIVSVCHNLKKLYRHKKCKKETQIKLLVIETKLCEIQNISDYE